MIATSTDARETRMIGRPHCRGGALAACTALLLLGCASDDAADANASVDAERFAELFENGFVGTGAQDADSVSVPAERMFDYRVDPAVRREVAGILADNLNRNFSLRFRIADPERFLRSGEAAEVGSRMTEALGLPEASVAGATVLMFGLAWELANGEALAPTDQQALLKQASTLLADHDVADQDNEARQREGDMRLLTAGLWLEEARLRRGDEAAMRELSDAVERDMKRMTGNEMRAHRITEEGFVDR